MAMGGKSKYFLNPSRSAPEFDYIISIQEANVENSDCTSHIWLW